MSNSLCQGQKSADVIAVADVICPPSNPEKSPSARRASPPRRVKQSIWDNQFWNESFAADRINLRRFPKSIVPKARRILAALEQGIGY
jgi:hypothetical protein